MTTVVRELFKSRENTLAAAPGESNGVLTYIVKGTTSETTARAAVLASLPALWDGKIFRSIQTERLAPSKWLCQANYDDKEEELDVGEWRISFDIAGGTVKKMVALAERRYPNDAPDLKGAINVQDGKVQGMDLPVGAFKFSIHFRQPRAVITLAYARTLASLVGKVCDGTFHGFGAREVMFLGARGQQGSKVDPTIDYDFLAGEHLTNFNLGGITVALKEAHEHLWCKFADAIDADELVQQPVAIYVDTVAEEADFAALAVGGTA
jgi:hypothetical protein